MLPVSIVRKVIMHLFDMMSGLEFWKLNSESSRPSTLAWMSGIVVFRAVYAGFVRFGKRFRLQGNYEFCLHCSSFCKLQKAGIRLFLFVRFHAVEACTTTVSNCGYMQIFDGDDNRVCTVDIRCTIDLVEKNGYIQLQPSNKASPPDCSIWEFIREMHRKNLRLESIDFDRKCSHMKGAWHMGDYSYGMFNAVRKMEIE